MNQSTQIARTIAHTLVSAGMKYVVISPGSRSAPLTYAFAELERQNRVCLLVRIDERVAAFTAVGIARGLRACGEVGPVGVVTTSGTAVANVHPAILEAAYSFVPLIALTADRPARLRATGANQTIDNQALVLSDVKARCDVPADVSPAQAVATARAVVAAAVGQGRWGANNEGRGGVSLAGPVQCNVQFDVPLVPDPGDFPWNLEPHAQTVPGPKPQLFTAEVPKRYSELPVDLSNFVPHKTVLVAGDDAGYGGQRTAGTGESNAGGVSESRAAGLARWAQRWGLPILAEPSSALHPWSVGAPDRVLDHDSRLVKQISGVVVYGKNTLFRSTAKLLARRDIARTHLPLTVDPQRLQQLTLQTHREQDRQPEVSQEWQTDTQWVEAWARAGGEHMRPHGIRNLEAAVARIAGEPGDLLIASSNAVRYLAHNYVHPQLRIHAARGLAGIDGLISMAVGMSKVCSTAGTNGPIRLVIGDIAALHDIGALLLERGEELPAVQVFVLNDDGGSIFADLEHAGEHLRPYFSRFFTTPHGRSFDHLATAYGWPYRHILSEDDLVSTLRGASPGVFELKG